MVHATLKDAEGYVEVTSRSFWFNEWAGLSLSIGSEQGRRWPLHSTILRMERKTVSIATCPPRRHKDSVPVAKCMLIGNAKHVRMDLSPSVSLFCLCTGSSNEWRCSKRSLFVWLSHGGHSGSLVSKWFFVHMVMAASLILIDHVVGDSERGGWTGAFSEGGAVEPTGQWAWITACDVCSFVFSAAVVVCLLDFLTGQAE